VHRGSASGWVIDASRPGPVVRSRRAAADDARRGVNDPACRMAERERSWAGGWERVVTGIVLGLALLLRKQQEERARTAPR